MEKLYTEDQYNQILKTCNGIVSQLSNPELVRSVIFAEDNMSVFGIHPWGDLILSSGNLSISLLMAQWDQLYPDSGFDIIAHNYFIELQKALKRDGIPNNISMFGGLSGMAFVLKYASHSGERYSKFLGKLHQLMFGIFDELIEELRTIEVGVSPLCYDVISGLSGVGRYFLLISDEPEAGKRLLEILKYCISLVEPATVRGKTVPRWYVAPQNLFTDHDRSKYPKGSFNCGLAHGITGPMSILSLALQQGVAVDGQHEAICMMAEWLISKKQMKEHGIMWPSWIPFDYEVSDNTGDIVLEDHYRDAWCYGTAGVCRSLYLAGKAANIEAYMDIAREGFEAVLKRNVEEWNLNGATFCHGYSGLLQIANRMYMDSKDSLYKDLILKVTDEILKLADSQNPFTFKDFEGENYVDKAGLLDGAAGIALSLVSTLNIRDDFSWDNCFLIS